MTRIKVLLLAAAAAAGFAGTASAMPISNLADVSGDVKQDVRLVCNQWGNCYETRRRAHRVYRGYYSAPAYGYYDAPYRSYGGPYYGGPGIGFSFGFGNRGWGHRGW